MTREILNKPVSQSCAVAESDNSGGPLDNQTCIHLIQKWPPLGKILAQVARKRGHKGQFGWNKKKKVNQLTLRHNCHFSPLSNSFSLPLNMQNSTETTPGPYDLVFIQVVPVFFPSGGHF